MTDGLMGRLQGIGRLGSIASPQLLVVYDVFLAPPSRSTDHSTPIALRSGSADACINCSGDDAGSVVTWGSFERRLAACGVWRQSSKTMGIYLHEPWEPKEGRRFMACLCPAGPRLNWKRWQGWVGASGNLGGRLSPSLFSTLFRTTTILLSSRLNWTLDLGQTRNNPRYLRAIPPIAGVVLSPARDRSVVPASYRTIRAHPHVLAFLFIFLMVGFPMRNLEL